MREAPALVLIDELLKAGCKVRAYDPAAMNECRRRIGESIYYATDMYDAALDADALMLVTEWKEFRLPSWAVIKKTMEQPLYWTDVTFMIKKIWKNKVSHIIASENKVPEKRKEINRDVMTIKEVRFSLYLLLIGNIYCSNRQNGEVSRQGRPHCKTTVARHLGGR